VNRDDDRSDDVESRSEQAGGDDRIGVRRTSRSTGHTDPAPTGGDPRPGLGSRPIEDWSTGGGDPSAEYEEAITAATGPASLDAAQAGFADPEIPEPADAPLERSHDRRAQSRPDGSADESDGGRGES
jgi:hypothetical protein